MKEENQGKYCYDHPRPAVTVDIVLLRNISNRVEVLLIKRGGEPFKGRWALPGGFVDKDEALERAAERELEEETGMSALALKQAGAFGDLGRDPRGHTVSIVFMGWIDQAKDAVAGDDASEAEWRPVDQLPDLAFDHSRILTAVLRSIRGESREK